MIKTFVSRTKPVPVLLRPTTTCEGGAAPMARPRPGTFIPPIRMGYPAAFVVSIA